MSGIGLYITGMIGAAYGVGTHSYDLPKWELSLNARLSLFREEFYVWSVTGIKLSVAFMLLRIRGDSKLWKRGLIVLIIFLTCLAISCSVFDYTQCHPVRAIWDFSYPPSACRSRPVVKSWEFATQGWFFRLLYYACAHNFVYTYANMIPPKPYSLLPTCSLPYFLCTSYGKPDAPCERKS